MFLGGGLESQDLGVRCTDCSPGIIALMLCLWTWLLSICTHVHTGLYLHLLPCCIYWKWVHINNPTTGFILFFFPFRNSNSLLWQWETYVLYLHLLQKSLVGVSLPVYHYPSRPPPPPAPGCRMPPFPPSSALSPAAGHPAPLHTLPCPS